MAKRTQTPADTHGEQHGGAKIVLKGTKEIRHDLFKLLPAKMKKNNGWKFRAPIIVEHEHTHIFHSRNEKTGKLNPHCSPAGGHFHEVKVDFSKSVTRKLMIDGELQEVEGPQITVGPALCLERYVADDGTEVKQIVPPRIAVDGLHPVYANLADEGRGTKNAFHTDKHTHDAYYIQTEYFTQDDRNAFRKNNYNQVRSAMEGPVSPQIAAQANLEEGARRGKQYAEGKPPADAAAHAGDKA